MKKYNFKKIKLFFVAIILPWAMTMAQTYTISPSGFTSVPSSNETVSGTTYHGNLLQVKATVSGSTVTFTLKKNDNSVFQNTGTATVRYDNNSGSIVKSNISISGGYYNPSFNVNLNFTSGSKKYVIQLYSGGYYYYSNPITITATASNPTKPSSPSPSNGATNVATSGTFSWTSSANDGGSTLNYDLYLGTSTSNMQLYKQGKNSTSCAYSGLTAGTKYYWKVIVYNGSGGNNTSDVWSFTTKSITNPTKPSSPSPSDGATNVATSGTFSWTSSANDGGSTLNYDLYLGTSTSNMQLYEQGKNSTSCAYSGLTAGTKYYWKVIVYNGSGGNNTSDVWSFTTKSISNPTKPSSPSPSDGATNVATSGTLSWTSSANDGGSTLNYDLYMGTSTSSMTLYNKGKNSTSCAYSGLTAGTKYYWKVIVYNGSGGSNASDVWSFTTKSITNPTKPSSPSPSSGATNVATSGTFSWNSSANDGGSTLNYDLYLGTSTSNMQLYKQGKNSTSCAYSGLTAGTKYYWKVIVYNGSGGNNASDVWSFTTNSGTATPTKPYSPSPSNGATNVATSGTLSWTTAANDGGSTLNYDLYLDDNSSFSNVKNSPIVGKNSTSCAYTNLKTETKYYWKVIVYNGSGGSNASDVWTFTTGSSTSGGDDMTIEQAADYLESKGVIEYRFLDEDLLREQLAKVAFRGLYSIKGRSVGPVPSDNYPSVYSDIAIKTSSNEPYYQAARALLYLEYGDGITPFDRNRLRFEPENTIARIDALKVLMETFNIQPNSSLSNPFPSDEIVSGMKNSGNIKYGYIAQAAELGIILKPNGDKSTTFRSNDPCTRGEAFIMLARIMKKIENGVIKDPDPKDADYFEPLNVTLKTIALGLGLPMGNFQHYTKTSFAINGLVPLLFEHTYNSYNTTLPSDFFGAKEIDGFEETYQPLGDGWSHNYHSFITIVGNLSDNSARAIVHWGGGRIDIYKSNKSKLLPESMGVYDDLSMDGNVVVIKSKSQMEYRFSNQGGSGAAVLYLSTITDRNGNKLTINYESGENGSKRISSVSDGNRSLKFSYLSGTNLLSSVKDPLGRSISFSYFDNKKTGKKQLRSFTDAEGNRTLYAYSDDSKISTSKLLTNIKMPKGNVIENQYDERLRLKESMAMENSVPRTLTCVDVTTSYGSSISTNSHVEVKRDSKTIAYNYIFNENNGIKKFTCDEMTINASYNDALHPELPTSMRSNSTNVNSIKYDDKGNVTSITVSGDGTLTTTMTYDSMNNLTSVTDPKGYKTTYSYDSKGNLIGMDAPEGVTSSITVNSKGLPTEVTDAMGVRTTFEYNSYGNLTKTTLPALSLSSTASYDKASRLISATDALGRTSSFVYDDNDNLTKETNSASHTTQYSFDANDNLTSITNAKGGVTSLSYDNATDWLTSVSFAGSTKEYEYNDDGTLSTYTKPDGTTLSYSYDDLGRVTNDGVNSYSYDSKLRLSSISGDGKTLSFSYDGFNRITGTTCDGYSNSYSYDKNGNCTSINNTSYGYDKLNRLTSVSFNGKTITYTYRKDSQLSKVSYPNGMTTEFGYDAVGRLTSKSTKLSNGTVIAAYTYTLDKVGNITNQTTQEPYGNISLANEDISYSYNSGNRITKAGDISFTFDANGNTTKRGSESYSWDESDRLTRAGAIDIEYNPLGLIASYGDITFTTDPLGIGNVLSDSKSGAEYIYGNGLEARIKNGNVSYYVTDVRGSVVAIINESGTISHKYQYDEYGKVTQKEEADYNPFQYVGKYGVMYLTDHLYYMRARHYDPTIGRFLSEDPIWSTNLYPYADNNPIMGIDPEGNVSKEVAEMRAEAYLNRELGFLDTNYRYFISADEYKKRRKQIYKQYYWMREDYDNETSDQVQVVYVGKKTIEPYQPYVIKGNLKSSAGVIDNKKGTSNSSNYGYFSLDGDPLNDNNVDKSLGSINKYFYYGEKAWGYTKEKVLNPINNFGRTINDFSERQANKVWNRLF